MHIPDGFIDAPVCIAGGVIAAGGIAVCLRGARHQLDEKTAPLAGLVAVFVFAMQMINFPVAAGTSGHLLGGALAVILVGPYAGALAVSVVIIVQALIFADGGLSALGLNVINMGLIPAIVAWVVFRWLTRVAGASKPMVIGSAFVAGFVTVPASAIAFTLEYAIGGTGTFDVRTVLTAMVSVHVLIGIGEGLITALTVVAVAAIRPDLVYGLRGRIVLDGAKASGKRAAAWLISVGVLLSLFIAGVVSFYASSSPDGLERVATDQGFIDSAQSSATSGSALAEYGVAGVQDERLSVGIAGVIGVLIVLVLSFAIFKWLLPKVAGGDHSHGHDVGERLYVHRHSAIDQLPAETKIVALVLFILIVVATPVQQFWAFAVYAGLLIAVAVRARMSWRIIAPRMLVEIPFVFFAVLMPFFGPSPYVEFLSISFSQPGLLAAWGILIKGTLGVFASVLLASTTPARSILIGLERMHVPRALVQIAAFMLRYSQVVTDEMHRMHVARESRGFAATGVKSWPTISRSAGALFIRSYERGERVHLAMLSRGYTGVMPVLHPSVTTRNDWISAMVLPVAACAVLLLAWVMSR